MSTIRITAADGHSFDAYLALPEEQEPRGAVLVIQEIFGVNDHIRQVAEGYAEEGYAALAPCLFDRSKRGVELGYTPEGIEEGKALAYGIDWDTVLTDVSAATDYARRWGKVGLVGYCWGGSIAFLAATRLAPPQGPDATSSYYGSSVVKFKDERTRVPMIMHLGTEDPTIPAEAIKEIQSAHPDMAIFTYDGAGHGFNCDQRADYDAKSAALAKERTLLLFREKIG